MLGMTTRLEVESWYGEKIEMAMSGCTEDGRIDIRENTISMFRYVKYAVIRLKHYTCRSIKIHIYILSPIVSRSANVNIHPKHLSMINDRRVEWHTTFEKRVEISANPLSPGSICDTSTLPCCLASVSHFLRRRGPRSSSFFHLRVHIVIIYFTDKRTRAV